MLPKIRPTASEATKLAIYLMLTFTTPQHEYSWQVWFIWSAPCETLQNYFHISEVTWLATFLLYGFVICSCDCVWQTVSKAFVSILPYRQFSHWAKNQQRYKLSQLIWIHPALCQANWTRVFWKGKGTCRYNSWSCANGRKGTPASYSQRLCCVCLRSQFLVLCGRGSVISLIVLHHHPENLAGVWDHLGKRLSLHLWFPATQFLRVYRV